MKKTQKHTGRQIFLRFLFVIYGLAMLWLLFGQRLEKSIFYFLFDLYPSADPNVSINYVPNWEWLTYKAAVEQNMNLIPLATIKLYMRVLKSSTDIQLVKHAVINLIGNVVMFVPLGIFLPGIFIKKPNFFKFLLRVTCMIILIEAVQLVTLLGSLDVDDLILNVSGATVGYLIWRIHHRRRKA